MIERVAGDRGAERCADTDGAADNTKPQVESACATRDVGHDEWKGHAENGG